ncbi:hypothetical protein HDU78_010941 [Chytriomyces hyalinus]|nr:hypothetical protein HDU78_010941 [Chytriomyces hyalinus]
MTRQVSLCEHQRQPSRTFARSYRVKKGDAEIPSDLELMRLEAEARFKARIDGGRLQLLHSRIVAQVQHELLVQQHQQQQARDIGQPFFVDVSNVAADDGQQLQVSGTQSQEDLLSNICLHVAAKEDELEAIFLPDHSAGATIAPQIPGSLNTTDDSNYAKSMDAVGFHERDYLSISNFEELLNAFPFAPAT